MSARGHRWYLSAQTDECMRVFVRFLLLLLSSRNTGGAWLLLEGCASFGAPCNLAPLARAAPLIAPCLMPVVYKESHPHSLCYFLPCNCAQQNRPQLSPPPALFKTMERPRGNMDVPMAAIPSDHDKAWADKTFDLPVDSEHKALKIKLLSFARPHSALLLMILLLP